MNRRTLFAALLVGAASASPALSADLYTKAPPAPVAPLYLEEWSGFYVGLEGGYGWGRQAFDATSIRGFGGTGNIAGIGNSTVLFPEFTAPSNGNFTSQHGGLFGGFAGAQKQFGSFVLGLEADFDASRIRGSSTSSGVQNANVSILNMDLPQVNSTADGGPFRRAMSRR